MTRVFVSSFCLFFVCLFFVLIEQSMRLHSRAQLICLDIVWSARRGYQKKMGMRRVGRHWSVRRDQLVSKQSRRQAVVVDSCETQIKTECREREKKTKKRTKLSEGNNPVEFLWQPSRTRVGALFFRLLLLLALIHFFFFSFWTAFCSFYIWYEEPQQKHSFDGWKTISVGLVRI